MNYTFILNNVQPDFTDEIEIIPKHVFRKAKQNEIDNIKAIIKNLGGPLTPLFAIPIYEAELKIKDGKIDKGIFNHLPSEQWRYYVIAFEGDNSKMLILEEAINLINNHLDFGITFFHTRDNFQGINMLCPQHFQAAYDYHNDPMQFFKEPSLLSLADLELGRDYYNLIENLSDDFAFIKRAISKFNGVKSMAPSDLSVLGYFSIIESLITHKPRSNETLDSINHQIVNKIILLNKRFHRTLDYSQYFYDSKKEEIWKKLYSYRSCLAHGNEADFSRTFHVLKNRQTVLSFIQQAIKLLMITSLNEPELVSDLRNC